MNGIEITMDKAKLLEALKTNRAEHRRIVEEARAGYVDKAQKALTDRLMQLKSGKMKSLAFALQMPLDHTSEYDTVIAMLESCVDAQITLTDRQFRSFVQDKWDWEHQFLIANSAYSGTATSKLGYGAEDD